MTPLRLAARAVVEAHRSGVGLEDARARFDLLTSDDRPMPGDLMRPCGRYLTGPVEPCAALYGHRGPCRRYEEIDHGA